MVTVQQAVLIVGGIIATFTGYSVFRNMMPLWSFILFGWITSILLPTLLGPALAANLPVEIAAVIIGGALGALLSRPLYFVIVFLGGAALGMLLGVLTGAVINIGGFSSIAAIRALAAMSFPPMPQTNLQYILMVFFALIMGALAVAFQKFMITASSAFVGAAALVSGLVGPITQLSTTDAGRGAIIMVGWLILGIVGLFLQLHMQDIDDAVAI